MSPEVAAATCLHYGTKTFWQACMNNMSCERYIGFVKLAIESGRMKKNKCTEEFDFRLWGLIALRYDNKTN